MDNYGVVKFIHSTHLNKNALFGLVPDNPDEDYIYYHKEWKQLKNGTVVDYY